MAISFQQVSYLGIYRAYPDLHHSISALLELYDMLHSLPKCAKLGWTKASGEVLVRIWVMYPQVTTADSPGITLLTRS